MQKIYYKVLRSDSFQQLKQFSFFVVIFFLLVGGFMYFSYSSKLSVASLDLSVKGSVSECMSLTTIPNQIEITERSMKRVYHSVAGMQSLSEAEISSSECLAKLA